MTKTFLTQADDQPFKEWLAAHQNDGFYLNERKRGSIKSGSGELLMHKADCKHLGDGAGITSTTYAKVASESRDALIGWGQGAGHIVTFCSSCKPDV